MKTMIEIPDLMFHRVKSLAASRGITLERFFTDALEHQMSRYLSGEGTVADTRLPESGTPADPPWMEGFGQLADLGEEHRLVLGTIKDEFEKLAPEDTS